MEYLKSIIPAIISSLTPLLAHTSSFLGFFDIKKADIKNCCGTLNTQINDLEKKLIREIIGEARKTETSDARLLDFVDKIDRIKKLELYLISFNKSQKKYFKILMKIVIISALLSLILIGASLTGNEYVAIVMGDLLFQWMIYIFAAGVVLYTLLGGMLLSEKKDKIENITIRNIDHDEDLPFQL